MLRTLAAEKLPWRQLQVVQVDERVAPAEHPDRNLTRLRESLLEHAPLRPEQIHAMPVDALIGQRKREIKNLLKFVHEGVGAQGYGGRYRPYSAACWIGGGQIHMCSNRRLAVIVMPLVLAIGCQTIVHHRHDQPAPPFGGGAGDRILLPIGQACSPKASMQRRPSHSIA